MSRPPVEHGNRPWEHSGATSPHSIAAALQKLPPALYSSTGAGTEQLALVGATHEVPVLQQGHERQADVAQTVCEHGKQAPHQCWTPDTTFQRRADLSLRVESDTGQRQSSSFACSALPTPDTHTTRHLFELDFRRARELQAHDAGQLQARTTPSMHGSGECSTASSTAAGPRCSDVWRCVVGDRC